MNGDYRTENFMFPLCCLSFRDVSNLFEKIISYSYVKYSHYLKEEDGKGYVDILNYDEDLGKISEYMRENNITGGKNISEEKKYIVCAAIRMGIIIRSFENALENFGELNHKINNYEREHGTDSKINIHKHLIFEMRDKKFDERMFRVYCAIKAAVGKSEFKRVTIDRIMYGMYGYKSKAIYQKEFEKEAKFAKQFKNHKSTFPVLLTDRQIRTTVDKLQKREFIEKYTYRKRATYYTTKPKLRGDKFIEKIAEFIAERKIKQNKVKIQKEKINKLIDKKFEILLAKKMMLE